MSRVFLLTLFLSVFSMACERVEVDTTDFMVDVVYEGVPVQQGYVSFSGASPVHGFPYSYDGWEIIDGKAHVKNAVFGDYSITVYAEHDSLEMYACTSAVISTDVNSISVDVGDFITDGWIDMSSSYNWSNGLIELDSGLTFLYSKREFSTKDTINLFYEFTADPSIVRFTNGSIGYYQVWSYTTEVLSYTGNMFAEVNLIGTFSIGSLETDTVHLN